EKRSIRHAKTALAVVELAGQAILGEELLAQVIAAASAGLAIGARHDEPGHDPISDVEATRGVASRPELDDLPAHLVAEYRRPGEGDLALEDVKIGVTDP